MAESKLRDSEKIRSATDLVSDTFAFIQSLPSDLLQRCLPAVAELVDAASEALPSVKFVTRVAELFRGEEDPVRMGERACALAYLQSIQQVFEENGHRKSNPQFEQRFKERFGDKVPAALNLSRFSFENALADPYVRQLKEFFGVYLESVNYSEAERRVRVADVHARFVSNLRQVCLRKPWRDRCAPFVNSILTRSADDEVRSELARHTEYQRQQYEDQPVLGQPFALQDVYVDTQCGVSTWGKIHPDEGPAEDPFDEEFGGRYDLLQSTYALMGNPALDEPILVQGVAGSGKSSFSMRLADDLIRRGYRPLRVRLKNLRLDRHPDEVLLEALEVEGPGASGKPAQISSQGDFRLTREFFVRETVNFGGVEISPYILILDGWDEISISAEEGFRLKVARLLEQIWSTYLGKGGPFVRVVLTGRPTRDVLESGVLRRTTPVLTVRPLEPQALRSFIGSMSQALAEPRINDHEWDAWQLDEARFDSVCARYEAAWKRGSRTRSALDVLGSPLLTFLAVRVLAQHDGDLVEAIESPTNLYRSLVDLTCENAAKPAASESSEVDRQERIAGSELRSLLHGTATAMTCLGEESLSYDELSLRLDLSRDDELHEITQRATSKSKLSKLLISYFFQSSTAKLGCEFAHKSFREYLFAEGIVELLKSWGSEELPHTGRTGYWADFQEGDCRMRMSRALAQRLAPQWLGFEVSAHLIELLAWEVGRSTEGSDTTPAAAHSTPAVSREAWSRIRGHLQAIWEWWAEGVHLRPQPERRARGHFEYTAPFATELIEMAMPMADHAHSPAPPCRTTTVDAHLGEALILLCARVHDLLAKPADPPTSFAPSHDDPTFFANYTARINAAGWRPQGTYPSFADLRGVDLRGVELGAAHLRGANLQGVDLAGASLQGAHFNGASLQGAHLRRAYLGGANLQGADLRGADLGSAHLEGADLGGADLRLADLGGANLGRAHLGGADFEGAHLGGADLRLADLQRARFQGANLRRADFRGADLRGAHLEGAKASDQAEGLV